MTHLAAASIVLWLLLSPALARAQDVFELETIAPGVMLADVLPNPAAYAFANSLIVLGEDGVLVVDTQQSLTAAESLIAEIRRMTDVPVRWVVNTHWHADHVNGNQAYAEAFPGVEFIAHATTAEDMATLGAQRRAQELAELPASIEARRGWLASGIGPDQAPLDEASRAAVQRSLDLRVAYLSELERITPTAPTRIVHDRLELRVGQHRVIVLHVGPAHTRGDLVVVLPDDGIVAVGDLLEEGMPWFEDASPAGWLSALRRIADLDPAVMVPSHGDIQRDRELLDLTRSLLEFVLVEAATPDDTTAATTTDPSLWPGLEQSYAERYGVSSEAFREAARLAVRRARIERASGSTSSLACPGAAPRQGLRLEVPGGELVYDVAGTGSPVVLIHGGLVDRRLWERQYFELCRDHRVIRYDVRPLGESTLTSSVVSHIDDLTRLLDALAVERAALVGLSFGGMIALDFALEHPDRVDRLVLVGAGLRGFAYGDDEQLRSIYALARTDAPRAVDLLVDSTSMISAGPNARRTFRRLLIDNAAQWTTPRYYTAARWPEVPTQERLPRIEAPTLVLVGAADYADLRATADTLAASIPNAHLVVIPDAAHHVNLDQPERFMNAVRTFLNDTD